MGTRDLKEVVTPYLVEWGWEKGVDSLLEYWFTVEHAINESLIAYIQDLRSQGIQCFLATNNEKYRFAYMLEHMGFAKSFDRVYASAHLGSKKPEQTFFEKIFKELHGITKEEVLFFDDAAENVESAKNFGIHAAVYTSFDACKKILQEKNN